MFYHVQILAKKGPLGTIWIAAHHDKRLKRSQVFETDVGETIDAIVQPEVPLALRLSGQLMLGIVRIYARKVGYLFQDCSDSFGRMKFTSKKQQQEAVNLPKDALHASIQAITLPEIEEDPDFQETESFMSGGGSLPGTPISLAGSIGTPERLRGASLGGKDGLRRSLSFEGSPYSVGGMDVDMMYTDEQFGDQMDDLAFDIEPEKLRSEEPLDAATPVRESGRNTLTPVKEGTPLTPLTPGGAGLDLEEVPEFQVDEPVEDMGHLLTTPDAVVKGEKGAPTSSPRKQKRQKVVHLILDVNIATGAKEISLDNKYVRSRLHNARDTLRDLEKDVEKTMSHGGKKAKRAKTVKQGKVSPSSRAFMCEDLLGLFDENRIVVEEEEKGGEIVEVEAEALEEEELDALHFQSPNDMDRQDDMVPFDDYGASPFEEQLHSRDEGHERSSFDGQVGTLTNDEDAEDDDALDVDEEGWSSRTKQTLSVLKSKLVPEQPASSKSRSRASAAGAPKSCSFSDILPENDQGVATKRDAARSFFECLLLSSKGYVDLEQDSPHASIKVTARDILSQA